MDRNGFATVFLLILIVAEVSDASLLFNLRKFLLSTKDSIPGSPSPIPGSVIGDNKSSQVAASETNKENNKLGSKSVNQIDKKLKSDQKPVDEPKLHANSVNGTKLDQKSESGTNDGTKLDQKSESGTNDGTKLDPKSVKETKNDKKLGPGKVNGTSEENKLDPGAVNEASKGTNSDPGKVKEGSKEKNSNPGPVNDANKDKKSNPGQVNDSSKDKKVDTKVVNEAGKEETVPPPPSSQTEKEENKFDKGLVTDESCDGLNPCNIQKDLIACIKSMDDGSKVVLVQNKGESNLKAKLSVENTHEGLEIPKKKSKRIPITNGKAADIVLSGGEHKCVLPLSTPVSEANYYLRFPSYDKLVTPVNGAYLLIFTVLIFGGMWTCIKFSRRRRQGGGIPYQELEMGLPESVSAADVETAEGWDQVWDDDWDEDNAVKSPGGNHVGSISANGLTSRSPNKDGWEDGWDD